MNILPLILGAILLASCGGGSDSGGNRNPVAPTPQIPNVTGNYSGSTTVAFPELTRSVTCPTTTSVTQSGSTVNIAPLQMTGQCGTLSLPVGQVTIDGTGAILGQTSGSYFDASCGGTYNYTGSGGFFGRDLRVSLVYISSVCYNMNITINLSR